MDSEEIKEEVRELLSLTVSELKCLKQRDKIATDELQALDKAFQEEHSRLTRRYRQAENVVKEINKTRAMTTVKIAKLEKNKTDMLKMFNKVDEEMDSISEKLRGLYEKAKDVKKMFAEKCLDIRGSREDFKSRSNKLYADIKAAEQKLSFKKDSLDANQQVLESKMACLEEDQEDCSKQVKDLKSLTDENHGALLKEMEHNEKNMKLKFSELIVKLAECNKFISNLADEFIFLNLETDKLSLDLAVEEKCNQKLYAELEKEEENLEQSVLDLLTTELNTIYYDNLELAKILRDDLTKYEENLMETKLLEDEKVDVERKNMRFDILKEQKFELLKKLEGDITPCIANKILLEAEFSDFKNCVLNKQELIQILKYKIAEKEEALQKREERDYFFQSTATKSSQLSSKATNSKEVGSKNSKSNKAKKKESISISNEEQSDPTIFSSFLSGESDMSFSMSSTMNGSKPDIINILANLSSSQFNYNSFRRNAHSTDE